MFDFDQALSAGNTQVPVIPHLKTKKYSRLKRFVAWLCGVAVVLILPTHPPGVQAQGGNCGPFTDVTASNVFCPFILQAFNLGITNGTSATTFSPAQLVPRDQMVTFFDRSVDFTLHRGLRTAIGRTWAATATPGGISVDVGGAINDVVTDGTFLWAARADGAILKLNAADRRVLETWQKPGGGATKLGVYAGLVWAADNSGNLAFFNPTGAAGNATPIFANVIAGGFPAMAFDGSNIWLGGSNGANFLVYTVSNPSGTLFTAPANVFGLVFDGTFMWMLLSNGHLRKFNLPSGGGGPTLAEDITLPGPTSDARMAFDGNNIWIPVGGTNRIYVVRPSQGSFPSTVILDQAGAGNFPYVAAYDGENVLIGGVNSGEVTLFKATGISQIRSFNSGAAGVRGIATNGLTFNIGDASGSKIFQF